MLLRLPASLHYPITVTELLKQPNDNVERFAPLFSYFYKTTVTEGDDLGNEHQVERTFPTRFESNVEGELVRWKINKGAVISSPGMEIAEIEEPCSHSVQFGGMCANCGKDMTEFTYVTEQLDASRAPINMVHNNSSLTVSQDEATRVEDEAKRRLLENKKLSLVVDLDQTIIHATVDPTVAEWQKDVDNPNHDAVKDVRPILLKDDGPRNKDCWYYIKLRPGLEQFLQNVSKFYELHIYTMGNRQYAKHIADIVDPEHRIFGERILSRDESGSLTAKNLQRLFPVDTKMVVIIDDRGDVWKWSPNLIKVTPYDFFVGIGDINSSFLPKKPRPKPSSKAAAVSVPKPNEELSESATKIEPDPPTNGLGKAHSEAESLESPEASVDANTSPLEHLVAMGGSDDSFNRQQQASQKEEAVTAQLEDRPLLQKQKQLEADDAAADNLIKEDGEESKPPSEDSSDSDRPRHNLLQDNDRELYHLEESLRSVHTAFFDAYKQQRAAAQGGRLGQLLGGQKRKLSSQTSDLDLVPDVKVIMPAVKSRVLNGTTLVFTGVIPLGMDIEAMDIAILARSFGADIEDDVSRSVTHLIAARHRTQKVRKAMKIGKGRIKIVSQQWLWDSYSSWRRLDETPYLLDLDLEEGKIAAAEEDEDVLSESESPPAESESEDAGLDANGSSKRKLPRLKLTTKAPKPTNEEYESDLEGVAPPAGLGVDDKSPVGGTNEDWSAMNDELADFLGSEAEESNDDDGTDSDRSQSSSLSLRGKKRRRDDIESGGESDGSSEPKKRRSIEKSTTNLSQTSLADDETETESQYGNGADRPDESTADVEGDREEGEGVHEEGDGWSDFEEEDLEAEVEKATSENQGEG